MTSAPSCWNDGQLTGQNGWVSCNGLGTDNSWMLYTFTTEQIIGGFGVWNNYNTNGNERRQLIGCKQMEYWDGSQYVSMGAYNANTEGITALTKPYYRELPEIVVTKQFRLYNLIGFARTPQSQVSNPSVAELGLYTAMRSGPKNATLDIGANGGTPEWAVSGEFNGSAYIPDFATELNTLLATAPVAFTDQWGNQISQIPINLTADSEGVIKMTNLSIVYTYDATVNFATELQTQIPATGEGNVTIPISISTASAGKVEISNLSIDFEPPNQAPVLSAIPSVFTIDEGTQENEFLDLSVFFSDDRDNPEDMAYELDWQTHQTYLTCGIWNSTYLSVDCTVNPDWNGQFTARVKATDSGGKSTVSNDFNITVVPVNDEPFLEEAIPDIYLDEDGVNNNTLILNRTMTTYFDDIEDDTLYFDVELDPENALGEIPVTAELLSKSSGDDAVEVIATDNWNVNDPPVWDKIDDIHLDEDTSLEDAIKITDHIADVDNEIGDIIFTLFSYTNKSRITIDLDDTNCLDILPQADWDGQSQILLQANDGTVKVTTNFRVFVDGINDRPIITISSVQEGDTIKDTVIISGLSSDVENDLETVEVRVGGGDWAQAEGTTSWMHELETVNITNGETTIEARAYDGELYSDIYLVNATILNMIEGNELPVVTITSHENGSKVRDSVTVQGACEDADADLIVLIDYALTGNETWLNTSTTDDFATWELTMDLTTFEPGEFEITVRAFDGLQWGYAYLTLEVVEDDVPLDDDVVDDDVVDDDVADDDDVNEQSFLSSYWWLFLIIALAVIILIVIVIIIVIVARKRNDEEEPQEPAVEPAMAAPAPMPPPQPLDAGVSYQPPPPVSSDPYQPPPDAAFIEPTAEEQPPLIEPSDLPEPDLLEPTTVAGFLPPAPEDELPEPSFGEESAAPPAPSLDDDIAALLGITPEQQEPGTTAPAEVLQVSCHECGEMMEITVVERPVTIVCWNCQAEGMIE